MKPPPESIWRWCSGFAATCQIPFAITSIKRTRALSAADFKQISKILFYPLFALASAVLVLQFYNLAVLNWFWPFFAGIFVYLIGAMAQFVRLVLLLPSREE
jgi:type II secretory pathway component PulF